mgnify:CR=1 FL=1
MNLLSAFATCEKPLNKTLLVLNVFSNLLLSYRRDRDQRQLSLLLEVALKGHEVQPITVQRRIYLRLVYLSISVRFGGKRGP